jgi:hypothetical protein
VSHDYIVTYEIKVAFGFWSDNLMENWHCLTDKFGSYFSYNYALVEKKMIMNYEARTLTRIPDMPRTLTRIPDMPRTLIQRNNNNNLEK